MGSPHALILPYPAQGHVIPLMELSHCLVERGFKITFVNTDFNHDRVVAALPSKNTEDSSRFHDMVHLVSVPDGLEPDEDRTDLGKLCQRSVEVMPSYIEELIRKTNELETDKITCMIADKNMAWALEVAKKTGIRAAAFWPAPSALLAIMLSIPKLIEDGILNTDGAPTKQEAIQLTPGMPAMDTSEFSWNMIGDSETGKIIFHYVLNNTHAVKLAEFIVCNSFKELESPVFSYMPNLIPIGPLTSDQKPLGCFWPEDDACLSWLDKQPANSVIYVAFGSFTIFDHRQFHELALGLELTGLRFLWVVRPGLAGEINDESYPDGFQDRISGRGKIVEWSPQQRVLTHPSIACFVSHCGWNSTIEGVRNGVPFLCWPYFCDQFLNQSYICDVWRTGLRLSPDESGIISREKIKERVEELLGEEGFRERSLTWKEKADKSVREGGSSYENFNRFVDAMKQ